jgi:hypothetical protein
LKKDYHGISGIRIGYHSTEIEGGMEDLKAEFYTSSESKEDLFQSTVINNLFQHRQLSEAKLGMTVRIHDSSFDEIKDDGFEVISSFGTLYLFNTTFRGIQAGIIASVKSGKAIIESCHFESNTVTSIVRAVNSDMLVIRNTIIEDNNATVRFLSFTKPEINHIEVQPHFFNFKGMVTAIGSNVSIVTSQFVGNQASRGGEILAFSSSIDMKDSCIIESKSMASVFQSFNSRVNQRNVYSSDLIGDFCPGILHEDEHSACFNGGQCVGQCNHFTGDICEWHSISIPISLLSSFGVTIWVAYSAFAG